VDGELPKPSLHLKLGLNNGVGLPMEPPLTDRSARRGSTGKLMSDFGSPQITRRPCGRNAST